MNKVLLTIVVLGYFAMLTFLSVHFDSGWPLVLLLLGFTLKFGD